MQNGRLDIEERSKKISDRLLEYGVEVVKLTTELNEDMIGRNISKQLFRAGTAAGANYEESCGAESKADFIHKMQIVLKELRESIYWLKLVQKSSILKENNLHKLIDETNQLCCIIAKSVITAKTNQKI